MSYLLSKDANERNRVYTDYGYDPRGNNELGVMFQQYGAALHPETAKEIEWLVNYLGPQSRKLIEDYVASLNDPNALNAEFQGYANEAYEQAGKSGGMLAQQLKGSGYGDGASGGALTGAYSDASRTVNQYRQQQMSPQEKLKRLMASQQGMAGAGMPGLQAQQGLFGPIEQRHQQNKSEVGSGSAFGSIMSGLGMASGAGAFGGNALGGFLGKKQGDVGGGGGAKAPWWLGGQD